MPRLATAEIFIGGNTAPMEAALARAEARLAATGAKLQAVGAGLTKAFTVPLAAIGAVGVKSFADFDDAMTQSLAIMGDVSGAMRGEMSRAAKEVGATTLKSATEAGESYFFLASAGLDAEQSIAALPQVAAFAQAGMFDMAMATDLATDAQSALGLTVDDAQQNLSNLTRVTDVLVKANTLANATVQQFSEALTTQAGAAMKSFNIDIEEGVAVLAALADQGIKAQRAGTGFSRVIRLLSQAVANNSEEMEELGLRFTDAEGNFRPMHEIVAQLETAFGGMSDTQRAVAMESIGFTARVQQMILPLLGTSDAIRDYETSLRSAGGTTAEVADKQLRSFSAQMKLAKDNIQIAAIEIGEVLAPFVLSLAQRFRDLAESFRGLNPSVQRAIVLGGSLLALLGPTVWIAGKLLTTAASLGGVLLSVGGAIGAVVGALGSLPGLILAGVSALALMEVNWQAVGQRAVEVGRAILDVIPGALAAVRDAIKPWANFIIASLKSLVDIAILGWRKIADAFRDVLAGPIENWWGDLKQGVAAVLFELGLLGEKVNEGLGIAFEDAAENAEGIGGEIAALIGDNFETDFVGRLTDVVTDAVIRAQQMIRSALATLQQEGVAAGAAAEDMAEAQRTLDQLRQSLTDTRRETTRMGDAAGVAINKMQQGFDRVRSTIENQLAQALATGKAKFSDFAQAVLADLARIIARLLIAALLSAAIGGNAGPVIALVDSMGRGAATLPTNFDTIAPSVSAMQHGGFARAGQPHFVGEAGRELFVPQTAGRVVGNQTSAELGPGGGTGRPIVTIDAAGSRRRSIADFVRDPNNIEAMTEMMRKLESIGAIEVRARG